MTTITVYTLEDGRIKGFTASGHAGSRKIRGYDLVCCAISALTQTGVNALITVAGTEPAVKVDEQSGFLRCILPDEMSMQTGEKADIVLRTVIQGLQDIQNIYPKFIRIQQKEWRQADAYDESSALRA